MNINWFRLLFLFVFPAAFLFGLGEILYIQAKNRGRSTWGWVTSGCCATLIAGVMGFLAAPAVIQYLQPPAEKEVRVFLLSIWVPAVIAATAVGGLLKVAGPVAVTSRSLPGPVRTLTAEEFHTHESCQGCNFLLEVGDAICQCPGCSNYLHVRCWNDSSGCPACAAKEQTES